MRQNNVEAKKNVALDCIGYRFAKAYNNDEVSCLDRDFLQTLKKKLSARELTELATYFILLDLSNAN